MTKVTIKSYETITPVERLFIDALNQYGESGTEEIAKRLNISVDAALSILSGLEEINLIERTAKSRVNHYYWISKSHQSKGRAPE